MDRVYVFAGAVLRRVRLSQIVPVRPDGGAVSGFAKSRTLASNTLLEISHFVPWISPRVRGLGVHEWIEWERQAWRLLHGIDIAITKRGVITPVLPGVPLSEFLSSKQVGLKEKSTALASAVAALRRAHELRFRWPDGSQRSFSHADAHVANVMFDVVTGAARWFDFETIHDCRADSAWRHADDLRAVAWSAAAYAGRELWSEIAEMVVAPSSDDVRNELEAVVESMNDRPHLLHLSQVPMAIECQREFGALLKRNYAHDEEVRKSAAQVIALASGEWTKTHTDF